MKSNKYNIFLIIMSTSTNRLIQTLSEIDPGDLPSISSLNETSAAASETNYGTDFFTNITWQTWLIIILILTFLGINIFYYLQSGTEATIDIFAPVLKLFGYQTLETTKQTIQTSATGTKSGVDIVSNTTTGTINTIENVGKGSNKNNQNNQNNQNSNVVGKSVNMSSQPIQNDRQNDRQMEDNGDSLQKALNDSSKSNGVQPDDSLSRIQSSSTSGKAGWCFIGEDQGLRTCSEIGVNDKCMSGDVFPTQDVCMNPNLRA